MVKSEKCNEYCVLPVDTFIEQGDVPKSKVVIIIHLFYIDTLSYYCNYIEHIPSFVDVYITYSNDFVKERILYFLGGKRKVDFIKKDNRGRDISALLVASREILLRYDYVAFLHDKKSIDRIYDRDVFNWSDLMWKNTIGSEEYISNIIYMLAKRKDIGLLVPPIFVGNVLSYGISDLWGENFTNTVELCHRINVKANIDVEISPISIGTVFWARCDAIKKLLMYKWRYEDFPIEPMSRDGTINHAVERCLAYVAEDSGYKTSFVINSQYAGYRLNYFEKLLKDYFYLDNCEPIYKVRNRVRIKKLPREIRNTNNYRKNVYIFGAGRSLENNYSKICENSYVNIVGFVENDVDKWHQVLHGINVISPQELIHKDFDGVVVSSNKYYKEIETQLVLLGVPRWNILRLYQVFNKAVCYALPKLKWCNYPRKVEHRSNTIGLYVIAHKEFCNAKLFINNPYGYKLFFTGENSAYLGIRYHCEYEMLENDNIADFNLLINECTAIYWMWKHSKVDIIAINHYRRFWKKEGNSDNIINNIVHADDIQKYLSEYDLIVNEPFVREEYNGICDQLYETIDDVAFEEGWNIMLDVIREKQPDYLVYFRQVMEGCIFYPCNMFATRKEIFDEYCEWLFSFIVDAAKRIDVSNYDDYSKRVIGFFAERMLTVWLMAHNYKIKTLPMVLLDDSELVEEQKCDE
ncbi:MAG: DUF4422 domain-containing protein [Selenomonadaceae bacterium]|nr:DUF4422 domain-containing protein [Selenomonadaceae bacterium]